MACVPVYCMNCGDQHGLRREPTPGSGYVGYLCDKCAESWSPMVGLMLTPDEHVARRGAEEFGELAPGQLTGALAGDNSALAKFLADFALRT